MKKTKRDYAEIHQFTDFNRTLNTEYNSSNRKLIMLFNCVIHSSNNDLLTRSDRKKISDMLELFEKTKRAIRRKNKLLAKIKECVSEISVIKNPESDDE